MGPLVWRFKTCSVITCCRQVVLLDAFAPWFSWHQRLTCRQAAAFPGSDLGASELVVSSRVPKCLHRIGSFGPPKRGSKSKASNQAAFIGLSCTMFVRETLKVDQCILCNLCWLCRGCEFTRLLPYGWDKNYCAARTELCTSVLSRISGLCNDCIRLVTNIRIVQHAGLTADGLLGVRLVIYIGMLANHENLDDNLLYLIPKVLSASLERNTGGSLDPTSWLQNPRNMPLHQLVAQHRVQRMMSGDTVIEFILCMKRLLSCHGDLQHSCILCKKLLPTRWMIILCEGCEHTLVGGGGRDTLSPSGIQILCLLHRMVEDIHKRRLSGSSRTPSVMVDAISEGMVLAVIAGTDTGGNWWPGAVGDGGIIWQWGAPGWGPPIFPPLGGS